MYKCKKDCLIIVVEHPSPEDYHKDLQKAIIETIQKQAGKQLLEEETENNATLLELLMSVM